MFGACLSATNATVRSHPLLILVVEGLEKSLILSVAKLCGKVGAVDALVAVRLGIGRNLEVVVEALGCLAVAEAQVAAVLKPVVVFS